MKDIFVIKRSGEKQAFEAEKIQQVAIASGISPIDSEEIVEEMILWVESQQKNTVSSLEIRDKLFAELEKETTMLLVFLLGIKIENREMATKYKEYFTKMLEEHKDLFDKFRPVHDKYSLDMEAHQSEFNEHGASVMETIRDWEDRLCGRSEGSGYGSYTGNLAEKFMEEVRSEFPLIDRVGIIMSSPAKPELAFELNKITPSKNNFDLKKIEL